MTDRPSAAAAVQVEGLSHRYPPPRRRRREPTPVADRPALADVNLAVAPGEVFGVLGPNGSGKSTLFSILATMLTATAGEVHVFGHDVRQSPADVRAMLGVVFQSPSLDDQLTAAENLAVHGRLYGIDKPTLRERCDRWLGYFGLADRAHERVARFSGGMRRRVEIARALMSEPRLLLLDEPTNGLDPTARRDLWELLLKLRTDTGMTLLLTTHLMDEAERCDRLAVMDLGRLVALDTPEALRRTVGGMVVTLTLNGTSRPEHAGRLAEDITERHGPFNAETQPRVTGLTVRFEHPRAASIAAELAPELADRLQSMSVGRPTLDDVFVRLTGRHLDADAVPEMQPDAHAALR